MQNWWIQRLINPHALEGLFDEEPPLSDFRVRELRLERRGPSFFLCGELATFPDHPRPTWDQDARRLEIRFSLSPIDHFQARGQATGGVVDLQISPAEDGFGVAVSGEGDEVEFQVSGIGLQVIGMRPYPPEAS